MIGQEKLVSILKSYTLKTLPHSILLVGERGCGKHTLIKELESFYNMSAFDITESISLESIQEISNCPINHFYIIDMTQTTERQQNVILKFLEEPSPNTYIILITTSKSLLLDTIINRCVSFEFEPYTPSQLMQFLPFEENIEILLNYCHTPGQIVSTTVLKVQELIELSDNIIQNVSKARYPNVLKISQKFSKDNKEALDLDLFYQVLLERITKFLRDSKDAYYFDMYKVASNSLKQHNNPRFNQELLIDSMMLELHELARGQ